MKIFPNYFTYVVVMKLTIEITHMYDELPYTLDRLMLYLGMQCDPMDGTNVEVMVSST